jgi:hypothetical protein
MSFMQVNFLLFLFEPFFVIILNLATTLWLLLQPFFLLRGGGGCCCGGEGIVLGLINSQFVGILVIAKCLS